MMSVVARMRVPRLRAAVVIRAAGAVAGGDRRRGLSTHVSVIGLHWKTDVTRLREAFGAYGTLQEAQLSNPARSSTYLDASLTYDKFEEALEAVSEMNGQELDGRLLRVSITDPPQNEPEE